MNMTRRGFLTGMASAVVAGGMAVPAAGSFFANSRREALRVALLGCGVRGSALATEIAALRGTGLAAEIVAVADTSLSRARTVAAGTGATVYRSADRAMAHRGVNAVVIATPDASHYGMICAALKRGLDVYCEAPAALTALESADIAARAATCKGVFALGTEGLNVDAWRLAASRVASGELGAVKWAQGRTGNTADMAGWRGSWTESHGAPSCVLNGELAPLLAALQCGVPTRVSGAGGVYGKDRETPDMFVVNAEYADGYSLVLSTGSREVPAIIRCADGSVEVSGENVRILRDDPVAGRKVEEVAVAHKSGLHDWILAALHETPAFVSHEYACMAVRIMDQAVQSYRSVRDNGTRSLSA